MCITNAETDTDRTTKYWSLKTYKNGGKRLDTSFKR